MVVKPGEVIGTAVDIEKVVIGTEQRLYMDKESTVYGPKELGIEEHLPS